jgi:hypothetical protein
LPPDLTEASKGVCLSGLFHFEQPAGSGSEQQGKDIPDTANCFKNVGRFRTRLVAETNASTRHLREIQDDHSDRNPQDGYLEAGARA